MIVRRIDETDRVTLDGAALRLAETTATGWVFRHVDDPAIHVPVTHAEWETARQRYDFRHQPGFFQETAAKARLQSGVEEFFELTHRQRSLTAFFWGFAKDFLSLVERQKKEPPADKADKVARSERGCKAAIRLILAERAASAADARREAPSAKAYKRRAGKAREGREAPSTRTLRKYIKLAEAHACAEIARHRTDRCRGSSRTSLDAEAIMARVAVRYLSRTQPTVASLWLDCIREFKAENESRAKDGRSVLEMPSESTFRRRISSIDAYTAHVARFGKDAADAKYGSVTQGLDATRPGQFVLMDEFRVPLMLLFVASGAWELMTEEERKAVERLRPWICVAMDAATRVVLGMCMSREASTDSVLACLRMVVSDKGCFADAVGALSPWDMALTPEMVITDMGSNFVSDKARAAIAGLRSSVVAGPAARAQLRALLERLFGTFHTQLIGRFEGRTFANIARKADYDAEGRASLNPEELAWALVRYVVDVYHNSPHGGLDGETPAHCWYRKVVETRPRQLPDRHRLRSVFGKVRRVKTEPGGVYVNNLYYHSKDLHRHTTAHGFGRIDVTADDEDLGGVLAHIDGFMMPLACRLAGFDGRSIDVWRQAQDLLRMSTAEDEEIDQGKVLKALEEVDALAKKGIARIGLDVAPPTPRFIEGAKRRLRIGWTMPGSERPTGDDADLFSGLILASSTDRGPEGDDADPSSGSIPADPAERGPEGDDVDPGASRDGGQTQPLPSRPSGRPRARPTHPPTSSEAPETVGGGSGAPPSADSGSGAAAPATPAPNRRRPGPPPRTSKASTLKISKD